MEPGGSINSTSLLTVVASKVLTSLIGTAAIASLRFAGQSSLRCIVRNRVVDRRHR
jgi:hypothetical protein